MKVAALLVIVPSLALCACQSQAEKLEAQRDMMKSAGASEAEVCAQERKITQAYLEAGDQWKYQQQKVAADIHCFSTDYPSRR